MTKEALIGLMALALAGCTPDWAKQNESNLIMRITAIEGQPGGDQEGGAILHSDICCSIFNDSATVTVELLRKNPNESGTVAEDVILTRYEVRFFRTDGHNQEGVDVPYRITGPLNQIIASPSGNSVSSSDVVIDVVRHQAKLEPPLSQLQNPDNIFLQGGTVGGGEVVFTTIAEITVFGRSTNDRELRATGQLQVTFSDFGGEG
jgi:hypothetical protein